MPMNEKTKKIIKIPKQHEQIFKTISSLSLIVVAKKIINKSY
jgi:hypothetical protein